MSMARVQPRGQVTIPQDIRKACGIEPGTNLLFIQTAPDTFECHRLPATRPLLEAIERLAVPGVAPTLHRLREQMGEDIAQEVLGDRTPEEIAPAP